ncbi:hypothetical protein LCGC14_0998640 [marine sediment metagenome]|uniref:UvrD-like helicase C-terminal domain-containing protein n=1 Tax=marine sediment metagenome TaxID=412755 RepID=A0A0F9R9W2_9ZZZZ
MELDETQQEIVNYPGSAVVVAGPGSGKTRVLTEKARKLLNEGQNILCLTFTRAAAAEMSGRVKNLPATTIHAYCNGVVGWEDKWSYDGLLWRFLTSDDPARYDWVLLDEAQDINELELDVVMSLIGDKIFAVGDPYQSIYGFQGAVGSKVVGVLTGIGCKRQELINNYRSSPHIVSELEEIFYRKLVSKNVQETGLTSILCRTNDDVQYVSKELQKEGIPHKLRVSVDRADQDKREFNRLGESNLRLSTIHVSKGLEFSNVILFGWPLERRLWGEEKRVLYVGVSRASKSCKQVETIESLFELLKEYECFNTV